MHNIVPRYLHYNITLNTATCFDPQGIIFRESHQSNTAQNQQLMHTVEKCKKVKQLKCRQIFVVQLYNGYWCSVSAAAYVLNEG